MVEHAVLLAVVLRELEAGDLRDGVRLVRGLERPRQQAFLGHRLRSVLRVDAGAPEEEHALHAGRVGPVDAIGRDREVIVEKFRRLSVVAWDAADLGRCDDGNVSFSAA